MPQKVFSSKLLKSLAITRDTSHKIILPGKKIVEQFNYFLIVFIFFPILAQ